MAKLGVEPIANMHIPESIADRKRALEELQIARQACETAREHFMSFGGAKMGGAPADVEKIRTVEHYTGNFLEPIKSMLWVSRDKLEKGH